MVAVEAPEATPAPTLTAVEQAPAVQKPWPGVPVVLTPLLTLAYVLLAPFLGLLAVVAIPAWHLAKWLMARPTTQFTRWGRDVALFFAAPFIGLAYIVALPFVGIGVIAWTGFKAVFARRGGA